jgi:hypothetical protein
LTVHLLSAFFFFKKKPPVDVSEHIDETTLLVWLGFALVVAFFAIRPELWRRLWFRKGDPRPIALARIFMGAMALWTMLDYLAFKTALFTDEGLYMTEMARSKFGGRLRNLWDAEHGFEHWYDIFDVMWAKFSILHMRSDPFFVGCVFATCTATLSCVILGLWTRPMTIVSWLLINSIYNYSPVSFTGGDTALRVFFFMGIFLQWGEAYSVDNWRRRKRAILSGARAIPAYRRVPLWPTYIMMVHAMQLDHFYRFQNPAIPVVGHYLGLTQMGTFVTHYWERLFPLAIIGVMLRGWHADYSTGNTPRSSWSRKILSWSCLLLVWIIATYLLRLGVQYYFKKGQANIALSQAQFQNLIVVLMTVGPVLIIGGYRVLRARFEQAHEFLLNVLLSKKVWIGLGLLFHAGIDATMNVGTFVQVMIAPYWVWLVGKDIDHLWRLVYWKPAAVGAAPTPGSGYGVRPQRTRRYYIGIGILVLTVIALLGWAVKLVAGVAVGMALVFSIALNDRLAFRARPAAYVVRYGEDDATIRQVALLRCWDLGERFDYALDPNLAPGLMRIESPEGKALSEAQASTRIAISCPALWWAALFANLPPVGRLCRRLIGLPTLAVR